MNGLWWSVMALTHFANSRKTPQNISIINSLQSSLAVKLLILDDWMMTLFKCSGFGFKFFGFLEILCHLRNINTVKQTDSNIYERGAIH